MQFVPVFLTPKVAGVWLKPISGRHYMLVTHTGTQAAIALLQGLVENVAEEEPVGIKHLVSADRDRLLAHLYQQEFGPKVASTITCRHCNEKFDIDFSLPSLLEGKAVQKNAQHNGNYELENIAVFTLPTGDDELYALQDPPQMVDRLLQRCVGKNLTTEHSLLVQEKMASIAPMLQTTLTAVCVECGTQNDVMFDMQQFLLTRVIQEQQHLLADVHLLALHYHWGYNDIMDLPRRIIHRYASNFSA